MRKCSSVFFLGQLYIPHSLTLRIDDEGPLVTLGDSYSILDGMGVLRKALHMPLLCLST